jgi:hypothetical protein
MSSMRFRQITPSRPTSRSPASPISAGRSKVFNNSADDYLKVSAELLPAVHRGYT